VDPHNCLICVVIAVNHKLVDTESGRAHVTQGQEDVLILVGTDLELQSAASDFYCGVTVSQRLVNSQLEAAHIDSTRRRDHTSPALNRIARCILNGVVGLDTHFQRGGSVSS